MIDDWLSLAGTEIINKPRTRAYIRAMVSGLSIAVDDDCEDLAIAHGEEYVSTVHDEAPWFAPYAPASGEFLGLYPLALDGFDDSTTSASVTETTTAGGIPGRRRAKSRSLRVSALAVATSDRGLSYGLSWLRDALDGSNCSGSDCTGDDLCYYASCPEVCFVTDQPDVPCDDIVAATLPGWVYTGHVVRAVVEGVPVAHLVADSPTVSTPLMNLVAGGTYRVMVRASGSGIVVSVPGTSTRVKVTTSSWRPLVQGPADGGMVVMEFTALHDAARVLIEGSNVLDVASVKVVRVSRPLIHVNQPLDGDARLGAGWGGTGVLRYEGPTGPIATSATSNPPVLTREMNGLYPGGRYRATALIFTLQGGAYGGNPTLYVDGQALTPTIVDPGRPGWRWITMDFTATASRHTVSVSAIGGEGVTQAGIAHLRLEDVDADPLPKMIVTTDPRTLRHVTVTSPLTVTEQYGTNSSALCKVEWTMTAGAPKPLGQSVTVSRSLPLAYARVSEASCVNGSAVLHNLITNPSFESGSTNWTTSGTVSNPTTDPASGLKLLRLTSPSIDTQPSAASSPAPVAPLRSYTASAFVRASYATDISIRIVSGAQTLEVASTPVYPGQAWVKIHVSTSIPLGITSASVLISTGVAPTGGYLDVDGVMLTPGFSVPRYFDGSTENGSWDGVVGLSSSTWTAPSPASITTDPDCPPPPAPPRAPAILNDCITTPDEWLRYVLSIPPEATQASSTAFMELTLTTSSTSARGVRVRFYSDPFGYGPEGIDECAYCGEFMLSYLPPNATLVVDSSTQDITVQVGSTREQAQNLLYGSDGGPMTWPELTCGVGYLVVIDLDAVENPLIDARLDVIAGH